MRARPASNIDFSRYAFAAAALGTVTALQKADADFTSPYELNPPANGTYNDSGSGTTFGAWTETDQNVSATTVDTNSAPASLSLSMSGSAFGFIQQFLDFSTSAAGTGMVSFDWSANLNPNAAGSAFAAFVLNGSETDLTTSPGTSNSTFSVAVTMGDTFGFRVGVSYAGSAAMTITNFSAPIPEPSVMMLIASGAVGLIALRIMRRRRALEAA